MNAVIFKLGLICILYVVTLGGAIPWLISQPNDITLFSGIVFLLMVISSIPFSLQYILNLIKGEK